MPYPFVPGEVLTSVNLNAALDQRMFATMTGMGIIPGAVVFGHASNGGFQTDSQNLFYDDVNNRFGVLAGTTPQAMLQVGKTAASLRSYNQYTDPGNGAFAYLGDWTKTADVATYGTDAIGTGIIRDVSFVRGGTEMMRLGANGLTATVASMVYSQPLPVLLGTATVAAAVRGVAIAGNYAYTTNQSATGLVDVLEVFDITQPTAPFKIAGLILPAQALGNPVIFGHYLYTGINSATVGLHVIDISDPKRPTIARTYNPAGVGLQAIALSGSYLYTGYGSTNATFRILDISDPIRPILVSTITLTGASGSRSIAIQGKYAYVGTGQAVVGVGGLYVIDISDSTVPTLVATYNSVTTVSGIAVAERYLYTNQNVAGSGFEVVDISDPLAPTLVISMPATGAASAASEPIIAGSFLFKANNSVNGIQVFNISNPAAPTSVGVIGTVAGAIGTALSGNRLYVMANAQLRIYNTFGIDAPTATIGALGTDRLYVDGNSFFNSDIYAQRSLMVGEVLSRGRVSTPEIDTITLAGPANDYIQGQRTMSGGGTITWGGPGGRLKWTARFIMLPMGRSATAGGYVQFDQPVVDIPAGQVYSGVARSADATGVLLNGWEALYGVHTVGGNQLAITYYIVIHSTTFVAPSNWTLIAAVNLDTGTVKLGTGTILYNGETYTPSADRFVRLSPTVAQTGGIAIKSGTVRNYNIYTDALNSEWAYLGEFGANIAYYGTAEIGSGVARDVYFTRGGAGMMFFESAGVRTGDGIKVQLGQLGASTNIATRFGIRDQSVIATTAAAYLYPVELHYFGGANVVRLQTTGYRRTAGSGWQGSGFRIQYAVDSSFTDGSRAYYELGSDGAGNGLLALGVGGLDRLTIPSTGIVSMPYGLTSGAAITITTSWLYLANGSGTINVSSGPGVYGDANWLITKPGTNNLGWMFQDYAGTNRYVFNGSGQVTITTTAGGVIDFNAPTGLDIAYQLRAGTSGDWKFLLQASTGQLWFYNAKTATLPHYITQANESVFQGAVRSVATSIVAANTALSNASSAQLTPGGASNAGYFASYNTAGTRLFYIGFDNTYPSIQIDSGGEFRVKGGNINVIAGGITASGNMNVVGTYQSNGRAMSIVDATHHYLYRPSGGTALYLSEDGGTTNYYRANLHRFDHSNGTQWVTIDSAGALNVHANNLYFPSGNSVVLNNNCHYYGKDTAGTFHAIIGMLNDNQIHIAYGGQTILARGWLYTYGHITPNTTNTQYSGTAALAWYQCTAYGFPNPSDRREKTDIRTLPDRCLDLVRDIIPKRFKWNHGPDQIRSHWGFIAQEVAETMSKAGHEFGGHQVADDEKQTETLAVNELVAVLWGAVQELSAKVELLEVKGSA